MNKEKEYINMSKNKKIALLKRVVRAANKDQKELMDKFRVINRGH